MHLCGPAAARFQGGGAAPAEGGKLGTVMTLDVTVPSDTISGLATLAGPAQNRGIIYKKSHLHNTHYRKIERKCLYAELQAPP